MEPPSSRSLRTRVRQGVEAAIVKLLIRLLIPRAAWSPRPRSVRDWRIPAAKDVLDMVLRGALRDDKCFCDSPVTQPLGNEVCDVAFARGQWLVWSRHRTESTGPRRHAEGT